MTGPAPAAARVALLPTERRRLDFLDALRGLAAAYVVVYHMLLLPQPQLVAPRWAEKFALAGGTGVTLFFLVSAFSLYYTMPLRLKERRPNASFYLHRFFRIAPLFYFMIIATLLRDYYVFGAVHPPIDIAASMAFVFNLIPGREQGFVWAGWTIGVEMVFYAFFPLIYKWVRSTSDAIGLFFATLLLWLLAKLVLDYVSLPAEWESSILQWNILRHLPIFAFGIVLYHAFTRLDPATLESGGYRGVGSAMVWTGMFGFAALLQGWLPNLFGDSYYWQAITFGALFMGLACSPWTIVVNRVTRYLGKVSYSVYLTHTTLIFFLTPVYQRIYELGASLTLGFLGSLLVTFAVVLPVSALTYRFVEEPGIRLGKKLARDWGIRGQPPLPPPSVGSST